MNKKRASAADSVGRPCIVGPTLGGCCQINRSRPSPRSRQRRYAGAPERLKIEVGPDCEEPRRVAERTIHSKGACCGGTPTPTLPPQAGEGARRGASSRQPAGNEFCLRSANHKPCLRTW